MRDLIFVLSLALVAVALGGPVDSARIIFRGDAKTAYRDPAAFFLDGRCQLLFTLVETEADGSVHSYVAQSESSDLKAWSAPRKLTPRSVLDYSSPGNVVRDGDDWVLCLQSYPRPGNRDDGVVRYADATARLFTMRSKDGRTWSAPELLRVKGPSVAEAEMGRMIDPYLIKGPDGFWWCFFKQGGASMSRSKDLRTWDCVGRTQAGENVCVLPYGDDYLMFHSPANGVAVKRSHDLVRWTDVPGLITLGQARWDWAKGRLTAGFVLDGRKVPSVGSYVLFFHGSGPRTENQGDFDRNASLAVAFAPDPLSWLTPTFPKANDRASSGQSPDRIRVIAEMLPEEPGFPETRIGNRAAWERLAAEDPKQTAAKIAEAEKIAAAPVPEIVVETYFAKDIDRKLKGSYTMNSKKRGTNLMTLVFADLVCLRLTGVLGALAIAVSALV